MNDPSLKKCHACGSPIAADGLAGCPRCLMLAALQPTRHTDGAERPPPPSLAAVSAAFPQLEILELIGQGGMGCVFKARQPQLNRFVALKILPEALSRDSAFAARFTREAQALAALSHPNIVTIHDFGQAGGFFFLLMEFVDGVNLRLALRGGRFTPEQALAIVPPLCDALQFAHERGIVHRDIKPENLLLDKDGRIKIADFGIAKMLAASGAAAFEGPDPGAATGSVAGKALSSFVTADNAITGTPGYMAPEQKAAPQTVDSRADIYSLGVVLYELLTGELPGAQLQPPSRKVQIDVRLDEIVLRALEAKPELRYATAAELRTQLEKLSTSSGQQRGAAPVPPPPSGQPAFLKITTSTLLTPAELATFHGQFFAFQACGQLILDGQQLTHTRAGQTTVIPLAAIRDVSLGQYPRSMNPAGISLVSVTYEEPGASRQVLLSPMEGFFAFPSTWDALAAEWHAAIRAAVKAATGREPGSTPREQLGIPGGFPWVQLTMIGVPLLAGLVMLSITLSKTGRSAGSVLPVMIITFALVFGFVFPAIFLPWVMRRRGVTPPSAPGTLQAWLRVGMALLCVPLMVQLLMLLLGLAALLTGAEPPSSDPQFFLGFPESIILAVLGGVGLFRLRQRATAPTAPRTHARSLLGIGLICFGMFLGGLKINEAQRDHFQRVQNLNWEIPRLQPQWHAAQQAVFEAQSQLTRLEGNASTSPSATDAKRQRFAAERAQLQDAVTKAKAHSDYVNGQIEAVHDHMKRAPGWLRDTPTSAPIHP